MTIDYNEFADEKVIENRIKLCNNCNYLIHQEIDKKIELLCGLCGCLIMNKTKVKDSICPAGYW